VKVLVVDDHPLILDALQHVLRQLDTTVTVYDAQSAEEGRALVAQHSDADLLLLDLHLPGFSGFTLLTEFRSAAPAIPIVVLSGSDRSEDVFRAIDLGAMGFIPKRSTNRLMVQALRLVLSGGIYLPSEVFSQPREGGSEIEPQATPRFNPSANGRPLRPRDLGLTDRQAQVFALVLQGKSNKMICRELGLAEGTIKIHVAAILRTLGVSSRTQAVIEASRIGLQLDEAHAPASQPGESEA